MTAKKWLVCFFGTALLFAALLAAFNVLTDPFGVFGDRVLDWYSYDETNNPRAAKIAYLEKHSDEYDSYIVGCSSTSSFPAEQLNEYYGASFYNMIMYGADMGDVEDTVRYLLKNCTVKNLVLNVYIDNGLTCDYEDEQLTGRMHCAVDGRNPIGFYAAYLFANPSYGAAKLKAWANDTWLQQTFDVFDEQTGAYDKRRRDIEPIGDLGEYLAAYPVFENYPSSPLSLPQTGACMEHLRTICGLCEEAGVRLDVVCAPVYADYLARFPKEQVESFYRSIAEVTDYWDFSYSSVSFEPRYFYDGTHFRNAQGAMALARMNGDDAVYVPEDYGVYVTRENVDEHLASYWDAEPLPEEDITARVPVLMYHHLTEKDSNSVTITPENFEKHIKALAEAGYIAVTFDELRAYVGEAGAKLPEKPIIITFDDGYLSNYEYAWPILEKYGMRGTIFAIGVSVGKNTYKDTDSPITPHFSAEQAREMVLSGVIDVQSHTYDMHQSPLYEPEPVRENMSQFENEAEEDFIAAIRQDIRASRDLLESATGEQVKVLAYPEGAYNELTQAVLRDEGVDITLSTRPGVNTVLRGMPQTLMALRRYGINDSVTVEQLLEWVAPAES